MNNIKIQDEIKECLHTKQPVVALESTVYSQLGLPAPYNEETLTQSIGILHKQKVLPAITAIIDGVARIGISEHEYERILSAQKKVSIRDLPIALAEKWPVGVTTVASSLFLAHYAGIPIFATGGIGGVHKENPSDISADLSMLSKYPILTVCAGAKSFLDLEKTLEYLETMGTLILGWNCKEFPSFFSLSSGITLTHTISHAEDAARILDTSRTLGNTAGIVVAAPPPQPLNATIIKEIITSVVNSLPPSKKGSDITPYLLKEIARQTKGKSVSANVALVINNCWIAAQIALAYTKNFKR